MNAHHPRRIVSPAYNVGLGSKLLTALIIIALLFAMGVFAYEGYKGFVENLKY